MFASRKLFLALLLLFACRAFATEFFVAPHGYDTNEGSISSPFATLQRAQDAVSPGDTVYIRGGTYHVSIDQVGHYESIWAYVTYLDKSGEPDAPIRYFAYPGENPIFDYTDIAPTDLRVTAFFVKGSWIHIRGIELVGIQVTILAHTQSIGIENQGSNNLFERVDVHDGQAIGFYLTRGSNNLVLNCDAYRNWDYTSENGKGGNVDGFGGHLRAGGVNNVFRGCRAWFNSDDGYDAINSNEAVTFENCWAFYNGYSSEFQSLGDGNGFKSGGHAGTAVDRLPDPLPRHLTQFCLSVGNRASGFYANHQIDGQDWYRNTAYRNGVNFNMLSRLEDNATDVDGYGHIMRNNLGFGARGLEVDNLNQEASDVASNYFTLPVTVTEADFVSLDETLLTAPRKANGDLPDIAFARLTFGSDLIDAGESDGLPYLGTAPDLGAFETDPETHPLSASIASDSNQALLQISGPAGWPYELQRSVSLQDSDWETVETETIGDVGYKHIPLPFEATQFFRLHLNN